LLDSKPLISTLSPLLSLSSSAGTFRSTVFFLQPEVSHLDLVVVDATLYDLADLELGPLVAAEATP
jgi:hypothetical protein